MVAAFDLTAIRSNQSVNPRVYPGDIVVVDSSGGRGAYRDIINAIPVLAVFTGQVLQ